MSAARVSLSRSLARVPRSANTQNERVFGSCITRVHSPYSTCSFPVPRAFQFRTSRVFMHMHHVCVCVCASAVIPWEGPSGARPPAPPHDPALLLSASSLSPPFSIWKRRTTRVRTGHRTAGSEAVHKVRFSFRADGLHDGRDMHTP
eukprot:3522648-Rhodomonas_salina.4